MKWIIWTIWGILCFIGIVFSIPAFIFYNIVAILWEFKISDRIPWGYLFYEKDYVFKTGEGATWEYKEFPDKNPWETYKRWMFIND